MPYSRWCRCAFVAFLFSLVTTPRLTAQESERPVTFDQAGRLSTLSPSIVTRLGLRPPLWPIVGEYVDARLYERPGGDFVIAVQKANGTIDRYPITAQARRELSDVLAQAMVSTGLASSAERLDVISEPAGNRFVVNQVVAGLVIYAPLAAALGQGDGAALAYLLTAGGTFFVASAIAQSGSVTKAQNSLATDGIWRGAILANVLRYVIEGDADDGSDVDDGTDRVTAAVTLGGALAGTVIGFNVARNLTDAEAAAAATASTVLAATTAGLLGVGGAFECDECRAQAGVLVGATLAGFPLGLRYVRRAPYRVTAGDVSAIFTTGMVGTLLSAVLIPTDGNHERLISGVLTGGFVSGLMVGDRLIAKRHDLTESQASLVRIGAFAGALIGFAIPVAFDNDNVRANLGFGSIGAILGLAATVRMVTRR